MADLIRNWDHPDEIVEFGGVTERFISIGGITVAQSVQPVGWHWREHFQPLVGGDWCMAHHVGIVLSGRQGIGLEDGTTIEYGPGELYDTPPGHDGWTIGDEDCVLLEWSGMRRWVGGATPNRVLATLVFTDIADSTGLATRHGDARWHDVLSVHYQQSDEVIERYGGRRVATTGDGQLATFDAAAAAVECAVALREVAVRQGLEIRTGVHLGEVELAGEDIRGMTVHEAARIMAVAGPGEVLASEAVATVCGRSHTFDGPTEHELKGLPGRWRLYRVVG